MSESILSVDQMVDMAARVSLIDIDDLVAFCSDEGLQLQDVTRWSTAYESGGHLAVHALMDEWTPPRRANLAWTEEIQSAVKAFRPRRFRVRSEGNRFTIEEIKPLTRTKIVHTPVFQLRVIEIEGERNWFLYWRRAAGDWWPNAGSHGFSGIREAVDHVKEDPHRCFRLN